MIVVWWFFGLLLAFVWLDRLRDARHMRRVADITRPEWDVVAPPLSRPEEPLPERSEGARQGGEVPDTQPEFKSQSLRTDNRKPITENAPFPRVAIIVPARNEAPHIEAALRSVLSLDYPNYEILAVDDRSTDSTGEILNRLAAAHGGAPSLHVLHITDLPSGWLGKPHAMWVAAEQAMRSGAPPEWILFTDADVSFRSDCLRRAVVYAERERCDHLVLFPSHALHSVGEKIMLGGFQMLFVFGHRPWKVHDPDCDDFIGLGPFNLIRRTAYQRIGTFRALRLEVIEDMKLGKLVKLHRLGQRNVLGPGLLPWSWGSGALGLVRNLTKNLFALMQFRPAKALGASALWLFLNLMPLVGIVLAPGWAKLPYLAALAAIGVIYIGMGRRTPVPAWSFLLYPIGTLLIVYTLLRSMAHTLCHGGVVWRGTRYELEELKKGSV